MWFGFYGPLDVAVVEVAAVLPSNGLRPRQLEWQQQDLAGPGGSVILEAASWQPRESRVSRHLLRHPPAAVFVPLQLTHPMQRIGDPYSRCRIALQGRGGSRPTRPTATRRSTLRHYARRRRGRPARTSCVTRSPQADAVELLLLQSGGQRRQRGDGRPPTASSRTWGNRVHRGHPGRYRRPAGQRQAGGGLGHLLRVIAGRRPTFTEKRRLLLGPDPAAQRGDLQPPGAEPSPFGVIVNNGMLEADLYGVRGTPRT